MGKNFAQKAKKQKWEPANQNILILEKESAAMPSLEHRGLVLQNL